jgi:two-component system, OmpR family, sensor histidine kinase CpxA
LSDQIADQGAGVPNDSLEKLFDPFYRVENHRSRETGGTGLGLAIVKTCIEACQGKVSANNLSPNGFEITILLKSQNTER